MDNTFGCRQRGYAAYAGLQSCGEPDLPVPIRWVGYGRTRRTG